MLFSLLGPCASRPKGPCLDLASGRFAFESCLLFQALNDSPSEPQILTLKYGNYAFYIRLQIICGKYLSPCLYQNKGDVIIIIIKVATFTLGFIPSLQHVSFLVCPSRTWGCCLAEHGGPLNPRGSHLCLDSHFSPKKTKLPASKWLPKGKSTVVRDQQRFGVRQNWIWNPALFLAGCMALNKLLIFLDLFLYPWNEVNRHCRVVVKTNEVSAKCLVPFPIHSKTQTVCIRSTCHPAYRAWHRIRHRVHLHLSSRSCYLQALPPKTHWPAEHQVLAL